MLMVKQEIKFLKNKLIKSRTNMLLKYLVLSIPVKIIDTNYFLID